MRIGSSGHPGLSLAGVFLGLTLAGSAHAQGVEEAEAEPAAGEATEAPATLQTTQDAFIALDYEGARAMGAATLAEGGHEPDVVARLYDLVGTSSAMLGEEDAAYEAYVRLLALRADATPDESLPPELQAPFLRARGWWRAQSQQLNAEVELGSPGAGQPVRIALELTDPLDMVETVHLRVRGTDQEEFTVREVPATDRRVSVVLDTTALGIETSELGDVEAIEYILEVRDGSGSVLLRQGSEFQPTRLANPRYRPPLPPVSGSSGGGSVAEEWWFWTLIGLAVAGGVAVGVYFALPQQVDGQTGILFSEF